ncbi:hypothetical protein EDB81DRAFT_931174 [Dactylonectria macrodidyma]|uniref:Uncharacterized protein n=1 Tax=Dactylonectria macrodidyma TaxID=307937 RepID=A0A9P9F5T6_9HYPO|nr:hypothetical protein EDB81DRAFT_931174 [Dactylonectria macrodidyma]
MAITSLKGIGSIPVGEHQIHTHITTYPIAHMHNNLIIASGGPRGTSWQPPVGIASVGTHRALCHITTARADDRGEDDGFGAYGDEDVRVALEAGEPVREDHGFLEVQFGVAIIQLKRTQNSSITSSYQNHSYPTSAQVQLSRADRRPSTHKPLKPTDIGNWTTISTARAFPKPEGRPVRGCLALVLGLEHPMKAPFGDWPGFIDMTDYVQWRWVVRQCKVVEFAIAAQS